MKILGMFLLSICFAYSVFGQPILSDTNKMTSSFESYYIDRYPLMNYTYSKSLQIHNYSGNWDFDSDNRKDSVFFVGTGGAHIFYHLKIVLTSTGKKWEFPFLESDFPLFGSINDLQDPNRQSLSPTFVVDDFDSDGVNDIYVHVNDSSSIPDKWKKAGVKSSDILIKYTGKQFTLKNFSK